MAVKGPTNAASCRVPTLEGARPGSMKLVAGQWGLRWGHVHTSCAGRQAERRTQAESCISADSRGQVPWGPEAYAILGGLFKKENIKIHLSSGVLQEPVSERPGE